MTNAWPRLLGYELRRTGSRLAGRLVLVAVGAGLLMGFVSVLPAYQSTFTAALESASFDVDLNGLFHPAELEKLKMVTGVAEVTPVLGMTGVPVTHGPHIEAAWLWVVAEAADPSLLPLNPSFVRAGRFDLGTSDRPSIVLDQELAGTLAAGPGDDVSLMLNAQILRVQVSAVTGPAARLRGPSLVIGRSAVEGLMPPDVLAEGVYTEAFIRGTITPSSLSAALPGWNMIVVTREEELESQRQQIEVSPPVVDVTSRLALVGLVGMVLLLSWQARERRKDLINVARDMGSPQLSILLGYLVLEGLPTAFAAGIGSAVALQIVINGYFGNIGVHLEPRAVLVVTLGLFIGILLAHAASLAIPARALRAAR